MNINIYVWAELTESQKKRLLERAESDLSGVLETVRTITRAVQERGDEALLAYTAEFDGARLTAGQLRVREVEFEQAEHSLIPEVKEAIAACI